MKTLEQNFGEKLSNDEIKKKYLSEGFIEGSKDNGQILEDQMWHKKVTIVFLGGDTPVVYHNLKLNEFGDLKGYGFQLPEGIFLISRYDRRIKQDLGSCLFKIVDIL